VYIRREVEVSVLLGQLVVEEAAARSAHMTMAWVQNGQEKSGHVDASKLLGEKTDRRRFVELTMVSRQNPNADQ